MTTGKRDKSQQGYCDWAYLGSGVVSGPIRYLKTDYDYYSLCQPDSSRFIPQGPNYQCENIAAGTFTTRLFGHLWNCMYGTFDKTLVSARPEASFQT